MARCGQIHAATGRQTEVEDEVSHPPTSVSGSGPFGLLAAEREAHCRADLLQPLRAQHCYAERQMGLGDRYDVVEIDNAGRVHSVPLSQEDFRGYTADCGSDRRHGDGG